ncbi:MAG: signal peptidase I [Clostridia bacterium]|nr:signal peptidase I [Clostridia bacterium]
MNTSKKIMNIALKVVTWLLVAFTVFMMIFTIVTVTTVDKNDRSIFGVKFYIVRTDSMSLSENNKDMDVHFNAGDIVIIKNVENPKEMQAGDVIAFMSTNSESYGETVTHMIREVKQSEDGKVLGYVTYGTNTGTDDEALVEPEYILGAYSGKLPALGNFFAFVKSTPGYIVCILVPFLLLILYNGVNVIRLFRKYKREQMEEMQAEKDKLEAERAENQRMMQELLALKAQLDEKNGGEGTPSAEPASEADSADEATTDEMSETKVETQSEAAPAETTDETQVV